MSSANKPLDFSATNPNASILTCDPVDRPEGNIYYLTKWPDGFHEQYTYNSGSLNQNVAFCEWDDGNDFVDFTLGYTRWDRGDATRFHRVLPAASAFQPDTLFAESVTLADTGLFSGSQRPDSDANNWMDADWAAYTVEYRHRKYSLLTDAQVDSGGNPWAAYGCKELGRYLERICRFNAQERKISGYLLQTYDPVTNNHLVDIPDAGFVPFYQGEIVYIWHQVPYDAVPLDAMTACTACVHGQDFGPPNGMVGQPFDLKRNVADDAWVLRWEEDTLLFKGLGEPLDPYPGPSGELLVDVHYLFGWQPQGWNYFPPPVPGDPWRPVRRRLNVPDAANPNIPYYGLADFRSLFKPRVS